MPVHKVQDGMVVEPNNVYVITPDTLQSLIVRREDGYYVLSEKTKKNLGGPYKTRAEAEKRLRQVEFFKHKKG